MADEDRIIDLAKCCFRGLSDKVGGPSDNSLLALDWAGIGDACCHARLILQHVVKMGKEVTWICIPKVASLFRDDPMMRVFPGIENPYRVPGLPNQMRVTHGIDEHFEICFPGWKKLNISHSVMCRYHGGAGISFTDRFFGACGMTRDPSIVHSLTHLGSVPKDLPIPYVVFEHTGSSHGSAHPDLAKLLVSNLRKIGVATVCVGGLGSYPVPGAIMRTGLDMYNTFSIVKGATAMVGRSSGNQSLACFLPTLPVFEIDVLQVSAKYSVCKIHPNIIEPTGNYSNSIPNYIRDNLLIRKENF